MKSNDEELNKILTPELIKKMQEIDDHPYQPEPNIEELKKHSKEWSRMTIRRLLGYTEKR
jgi:hypothetical protein